ELDQLREHALVPRLEVGQDRVRRHHFPPSMERTWPVIQPALSDAKNNTPLAMSSGEPRRFSAIRSIRSFCPSSPYDCHWRSVVGLERTKPGAMLFTVMPHGPSSCANCRVRAICAALAEA